MRAVLTSTLALLLMAFANLAQAQNPFAPDITGREGIDIGTSTSEIAITSDFSGADLTVFGALTNTDQLLLAIGEYDVVVTLEGPREDATVRRKERLMGIWVNRTSVTFERMPLSYSLASTRPVDDIAPRRILDQVGVGIEHRDLVPTGFISGLTNITEFRDAFRRLKETNGLYQRDTNGVRFVSSSLFRATLRLPANIPNGVHMVRAYLFKSGEFIAEKELPLRVVKTGLEEAITSAAHDRPVLYGMFAVLLALVTGWSASLIFRKD
ncbi:TIGR02186 family protein [Peteryoungia desertarenae]|uniref:TIGR02186 family protein n=2 Tax=Peteryoungia desertarenae TaxID=1813451 RepID=A0ABX6QL80_9HYPH|nr:TIGR02186 family protein [Peteryoungia desertarenae]QLF69299.1 TIGR02186 family protein [Peteryoungia desertarenae]